MSRARIHNKRANSSPFMPFSTKPLLSRCVVSVQMLDLQFVSLQRRSATASATIGSDGVVVTIRARERGIWHSVLLGSDLSESLPLLEFDCCSPQSLFSRFEW